MAYSSLLRTGIALLAMVSSFSLRATGAKKALRTKPSEAVSVPGTKEPFTIKRGDCEVTFGGKAKIEFFLQDNMYLLNNSIPDQNEFFKESINLNLDVAYGKEKYGYKAAEFYANLVHKGIWGRATGYADKDSGPIAPSSVRLSQSIVGSHSHVSGKAIPWFSEAWLKFSPNAALAPLGNETLMHHIQLGWFPFQLGRGIALGSLYSVNRSFLGLYNTCAEDKGAPGIDVHGVIVKDRLEYDFYYSKFEERGKSFSDVINFDRIQTVNRVTTPWRGVGKDNDLVAGRVQWTALKDSAIGSVTIEPFIFYNAASDQNVEMPVDSKANWGAYGIGAEHKHGNFECGAEFAFNYGEEKLFFIDRNVTKIENVNGQLYERFSHIYTADPATLLTSAQKFNAKALVTNANKDVEKAQIFTGKPVNGLGGLNGTELVTGSGLWSAANRFRPAYTNKFGGWMGVFDGAYTFTNWDLQIAAAYGYASGDVNPHNEEKDKTYKGFVGLHEGYNGKRVQSIMLDERLLKRPLPFAAGDTVKDSTDVSFTDIQHAGLGLTWKPKLCIKNLNVNPNIIGFWGVKPSYKFIPNADPNQNGTISATEHARSFLGTEFNLLSSCSIIQDLKMFVNTAFFVPGSYFTDMSGLRLTDDFFRKFSDDISNDFEEAQSFGLANNNAFHVNVGFEYKF